MCGRSGAAAAFTTRRSCPSAARLNPSGASGRGGAAPVAARVAPSSTCARCAGGVGPVTAWLMQARLSVAPSSRPGASTAAFCASWASPIRLSLPRLSSTGLSFPSGPRGCTAPPTRSWRCNILSCTGKRSMPFVLSLDRLRRIIGRGLVRAAPPPGGVQQPADLGAPQNLTKTHISGCETRPGPLPLPAAIYAVHSFHNQILLDIIPIKVIAYKWSYKMT